MDIGKDFRGNSLSNGEQQNFAQRVMGVRDHIQSSERLDISAFMDAVKSVVEGEDTLSMFPRSGKKDGYFMPQIIGKFLMRASKYVPEGGEEDFASYMVKNPFAQGIAEHAANFFTEALHGLILNTNTGKRLNVLSVLESERQVFARGVVNSSGPYAAALFIQAVSGLSGADAQARLEQSEVYEIGMECNSLFREYIDLNRSSYFPSLD